MSPGAGHDLATKVIDYKVMTCCFVQGCKNETAWSVTAVVNKNSDGRLALGARCWACDEHKDVVTEERTYRPVVEAL